MSYVQRLTENLAERLDNEETAALVISIIEEWAEGEREKKRGPVAVGSFGFGKYLNKTFEDVAALDIRYCRWASKQTFIDEEAAAILHGLVNEHDAAVKKEKADKLDAIVTRKTAAKEAREAMKEMKAMEKAAK